MYTHTHAEVVPVECERVKSLEDEIRRLKAELHTLSIEASRKTQKALALEIKVDRLLLKLQVNPRFTCFTSTKYKY